MNRPVIILGGGLWGGLLAYFLTKYRPEIDFMLMEQNHKLGGNHTWSFHEDDISPSAFNLIQPMIEKSWDSYEVRFPKYSRTVKSKYHSISSSKFHQTLLNEVPSNKIKLGEKLEVDKALLQASFVIDARGKTTIKEAGYQNFLGLEVELNQEHQLQHPILMDATVEQRDGFRFIYTLPFDEKRLLIEDTRYSDHSNFNADEFEQEIFKICSHNGWQIKHIVRKEIGSLPIPLLPPDISNQNNVISLAGIFHDTTGYSLPDALRVIESILSSDFSFNTITSKISDYRKSQESQRSFFRLLNKFIFRAALPDQRYRMLQHFYRLPEPLVKDFYAGKFGWYHKLRLFTGRPPVSIKRAILEVIK